MEELLKQLMEQMNTRFDKLNDDINFLKEESSVIKEEVSIIKETVTNNSTEGRSHFKHIEVQLNEQQKKFKVVEGELKKVNIDIEYLSSKTGNHDAEINNINKRIQS
ncbi:hypothetical protein [Jeotgalibacillus marinus]|uniref:Uncharacterized protein n=1 Tax=Jeotgalibacillus marinus TaxID=86667 RepID=A0ABV3Q535_9BACL